MSGLFLCVLLAISNASSQPRSISLEDPVEYFNQRTKALSLAQNEKWQELIPIAVSLTEQYRQDGDLFYILGLSYYQTKQYQKAIKALKTTLDLGGTILVVPTGSRPSNDIMIRIAKAYALDGDKSNAMAWLQKGIASRFDEKHLLKGDPAFEDFNKDEDFLQLFGIGSESDLSREESWARDLNYLQKRIAEVHYDLNDVISEADFNRFFVETRSSINSLSDEQIVVEIMKFFGGLGSGHNLILPTSPKVGALKKLPVQFYRFNDGMFIVDAEEDFKQWIGYKVESIGGTSIEAALKKTNAVNARDNDMQTLWLGPYYLGLPDVLEGLGIIKNKNEVEIVLSDANRRSRIVSMKPITWNFTDLPKIPPLRTKKQPLFLSRMNDPYWYKILPEYSAAFVQFNVVAEKKDQSLREFSLELRDQISKNRTQNLILDLRHNAGGNGEIRHAMLECLIEFEVLNPKGKIFVLMGRGTYSAAQNLLTEVSTLTNAILVGEPSSSRPSFVGESGWFQLPYSGLMGIIASQYHKSSEAEDFRKWVAPHIPVGLSSSDYFAGNDRALDVVMKILRTSEK